MKSVKSVFSRALAVICSLFVFTSLAHADVGIEPEQDNGFQPTTVVVVRHAEKAASPKKNPRLTAAGTRRAKLLANMFASSDVDFIYSSQYERTRATVTPLAKNSGISIQVVRAGKTKELVDRIMATPGSLNVVSGHSNTVNLIIEALGGGKMAEIPDNEFDNMFMVTVYAPGKANVVKMKY